MAHSDNKSTEPTKIRFVYQKARHHRTFRADGAWASTSPQGEVQFAFFNDLRPMPESVTHAVKADGALGEEVSREHDPQNILREANVTVVMDKEKTKQFIALLAMVVTQLEKNESDSATVNEKSNLPEDAVNITNK